MNTATYNPTARPSAGTVQNFAELGGRVLLSSLFLVSGIAKIGGYTGIEAYMTSVGVPAALLPLVIATEVLGAIAIILGWQTRIVAFLLAGFAVLSALIFHNDFANQIQMVMFLKNLSIAGGFFLLVAHGAGPLSLDRRASK